MHKISPLCPLAFSPGRNVVRLVSPPPRMFGVGKSLKERSRSPPRASKSAEGGTAQLHVWDVSTDPPVEGAGPGKATPKKRRPAKRVRVNAAVATPMENEHFVGHVMVLHRPIDEASTSSDPWAWYFTGKTRVWEIRTAPSMRVK